MISGVEALLFLVVLGLVTIWAVFWIIRLAVRYGVSDALEIQRARESAPQSQGSGGGGDPSE